MSSKVILVFCAQAFLVQLAFSSCIGRPNLGAGRPSCGSCTPNIPRLGGSGCAGSILPTPGCSCLGNGIDFGNAGLGCGSNLGYGSGLGYGSSLGYGSPIAIPTSGGSFVVTSSSPIAPTGLSIVSENVFEGTLCVDGELPFVGTVTVDGEVPSGGAGAVNHSCGDGVTAIESIAPSDAVVIAPPGIGAFGPGIGAYGPGYGAFGAGVGPFSGIGCNGLIPDIVPSVCGC